MAVRNVRWKPHIVPHTRAYANGKVDGRYDAIMLGHLDIFARHTTPWLDFLNLRCRHHVAPSYCHSVRVGAYERRNEAEEASLISCSQHSNKQWWFRGELSFS
jgi:hypothetical protein